MGHNPVITKMNTYRDILKVLKNRISKMETYFKKYVPSFIYGSLIQLYQITKTVHQLCLRDTEHIFAT